MLVGRASAFMVTLANFCSGLSSFLSSVGFSSCFSVLLGLGSYFGVESGFFVASFAGAGVGSSSQSSVSS